MPDKAPTILAMVWPMWKSLLVISLIGLLRPGPGILQESEARLGSTSTTSSPFILVSRTCNGELSEGGPCVPPHHGLVTLVTLHTTVTSLPALLTSSPPVYKTHCKNIFL